MKIFKLLIIAVLVMLSIELCFAGDLSGLDAAGMRVLNIIRRVGYWIILFKGLAEILKSAMSKDFHGVGQIIIQYTLIFASLWFFPWALQLGKGLF